jgi:Sulfotransferase family
VDPSALAAWTPVAVNVGPLSIDWGDLRGWRFAEPFFHQTVERWAGGNPEPLVRTDFASLALLDAAPSLDPSALVFHLSRCGSTLVSRLLATAPNALVIAEPGPINTLLMEGETELGEATMVAALRALVRALGRKRFGDERHYVLKLSSWNMRRVALFRRAFPRAPIIWVQREPAEVLASLLADPPGWAKLRFDPDAARAALGIAPGATNGDEASFFLTALEAMLESVAAIEGGRVLAIDYRDLPQAVCTRVAPFIGLDLATADLARMEDVARLDSKSATPKPFVAKRLTLPPLDEAVRARLAKKVAPLYRTLAQRHGAPG